LERGEKMLHFKKKIEAETLDKSDFLSLNKNLKKNFLKKFFFEKFFLRATMVKSHSPL